MDGDQNCLTNVGKLPKEANSVESSLSIKTGGRFIKEDQDRWLRNEFNANGDALTLFNRETSANASNECVFEIVELQKVDDSVNIGKLLLTRGLAALTEKSRELECFTNRAEGLVNIELLTIACGTLERYR